MKQYKVLLSIIILVILYGVSLIGITVLHLDLMHSTPFSILISPFLLFASHTRFDKRFLAYVLIVFFAGFVIQLAGVETGRIFGQFFYGNGLGYKLWDIPISIGISWLILSYCSSVVTIKAFSKLSLNTSSFVIRNSQFLIPFVASLLILAVDLFVEQVAPVYDFWYWKGQQVPFQNYTAWFAFSFAFNFLFYKLNIAADNKVALWLYGLYIVFFAGLALAE
jgi:uncharacterized membrane protein